MEQSPENNAAVLALLGWATREAMSCAAQAQEDTQERPQRPRSGASEEELSRLLQLVSSAMAPMALLTDIKSSSELGQAVARTQLPQALASLLTALFPPGFRCCGGGGGASGNSRGDSSGGGSAGVGSAGLRMRLDLLVYAAGLTSGLWSAAAHRVPELVTCLRESQLLECIAAALLRAPAAECGQQQHQRSGGAGAGPSTSGSHRNGGTGSSCYVAWLRSGKQAKQLWLTLRTMTKSVVTMTAPTIPPRTWVMPENMQAIAGDLPQCREALSGPAVQLWLGRTLVAETHRCLAEAEEEAAEAVGGRAAGGSAADSSGAAAVLTGDVQQQQQQWFALPESLRSGGLPLPRERSNTADLLMDVVESVGAVWDFTVSGPRLPRLGQQPQKAFFERHPAGGAMRKVIGGVGTPAEAAAVAAAEAQLPPLHPPSYTAVQVYEMTHAALTAALDHAPAEAVCLHAPSLLARLVMELPPSQAAARLPSLWRTLSRVLPRLACGGTGAPSVAFGMMSQGPFWDSVAVCRSESTRLCSFHLGMLLQLQLTSAGRAASADSAAANAATAVGGAGPGPDFSLRCALSGGLLPAIEALLRRLCRTAAQATAGPSEAAGFVDAAQQASYTVHILLRCSGVWPAVLAYGPPQQVASLVRTMGKALAVVGDTFAALRQRPQLLGPATQMARAARGNTMGQANFFSALVALLEQASVMAEQGMVFHGLRGYPDAAVAAARADQHRQERSMMINDAIAKDPFTLDIDWVAAVGGCPSADTAAARKQQTLASWAVQQWVPEMLRQVERDGPTAVNRVYAVGHLQDMVYRALWPVMREHLLAGHGTAAASTAAPCPPGAAASAVDWRHFLLDRLDALSWTERLLARVADATPTADDINEGPWFVRLGLSLLAVSELPGGVEACDAAASAGGCKAAAGSSSVAAAASGKLQAGGVAGVNSTSRQQQRRQQQQRMLQHLRRMLPYVDAGWAATITHVELSLQAVWEQVEAVGLHPSDTTAAGTAAAVAVDPPPLVYKVPERLLKELTAGRNRYVVVWSSVPLAPGTEQVVALPGEAGLVLCGNPACSSLEGDSEAVLMAAGAAGQQRGGRGGAAGGGGRIKTCSRCGAVRYCCGACQLQHWTTGGHMESCAGAAGGSGGAGGGSKAGR